MITPAVISVFNNKGGVGKTTLTFHLGHALASLGYRTLFVDLDPQCNLTIYSLAMETIDRLWSMEDRFIDIGFESSKRQMTEKDFASLNATPRSIHYVLKPTEEGTGDVMTTPPPQNISRNLDIVPGRITLHMYEEKVASRWSDVYRGEELAIRTITRIRSLIQSHITTRNYDYVLVDTSPSLGALNKVAITTVDAFLIPCLPDLFSLYGIKNIGRALSDWSAQFKILETLLSEEKRQLLPKNPVGFLGFTIFNAKKYSGSTPWNLAQAHYNYALKIPPTITEHIPDSVRHSLSPEILAMPIGGMATMHSHSTLPSMAQKYHVPMWEVPDHDALESSDRGTVSGNRSRYTETHAAYRTLAKDVIHRIDLLRSRHQNG